MRFIRELKQLSGGRCLVCLEDDSVFPLYGKELADFGIEEGGTLSEETYGHIIGEVLSKRVRLCTLHMLEKMDRTERQLRDKLTGLYYPVELVEEAVAYAKSYHYIDDFRYAENYIESHGGRKSLRRIEQELLVRGISRELFCEALERADRPDEKAQIAALLQKKHFDPQNAAADERSRMYAFLMRRGYSAEAIRHALRG